MSGSLPSYRWAGWLVIGLLLLAPRQPAGAAVLPMAEEIQTQSQWCWAAVARSILRYYGHKVSQCDIAEYTRSKAAWHDFGKVHCCADPTKGCNYWNFYGNYAGSIQDIIRNFASVASLAKGYPLDKTASRAEIDTGKRPFVVRWGWSGGGGHFVLAHGLVGDTMHYMNPWFGEGKKIADFDWVTKGGNHTWTHTLRITSTCRCTAKNTCCDGCKPKNRGSACADGDACTSGDVCDGGGLCEGPAQVICDTPGPCRSLGACDTKTGGCVYPHYPDGTHCSDGSACTEGDICLAGTCLSPRFVVCDLPSQCQKAGACDKTSGECVFAPLDDGMGCDDGDLCTADDRCAAGICSPGKAKECVSENPCLGPGICQPVDGRCAHAVLPDGTRCAQGICTDGVCAPSPAVDSCATAPTRAPIWPLPLLVMLLVSRFSARILRLRRASRGSRRWP